MKAKLLPIELPPCREANKQKYEMEGLNEKCEVLMEHSACSHVRDHAVNAQGSNSIK